MDAPGPGLDSISSSRRNVWPLLSWRRAGGSKLSIIRSIIAGGTTPGKRIMKGDMGKPLLTSTRESASIVLHLSLCQAVFGTDNPGERSDRWTETATQCATCSSRVLCRVKDLRGFFVARRGGRKGVCKMTCLAFIGAGT